MNLLKLIYAHKNVMSAFVWLVLGGSDLAEGPGWRKCEARGREMVLPSAVPERPSALKLLVLFFLRCFLRLACGEGGGSILGLVVLEMLGLEQTESPRPVSANPNKHSYESNNPVKRLLAC